MKRQIETHLATAVRGLPPEKIFQVIDFADYLRSKYAPDAPQRGSVEVILQALEQVGTHRFDALAAKEFGRIQAEQKAKGRSISLLAHHVAFNRCIWNLCLYYA